jgi:hypothetical protein
MENLKESKKFPIRNRTSSEWRYRCMRISCMMQQYRERIVSDTLPETNIEMDVR